MSHHIDYRQITETSRLRATDTHGSEFTVEDAVVIPIVITEVAELLAEYDPSNPASLIESTARHLAQTVLDALARFKS